MTNPEEIKKLSRQRLEEARILFENKMHDGAFYLAGYSVELMLKAKICERLGIPNLFDETGKNANNVQGIGDIRRTLKTHNLFTLLIFSGLKVDLELMTASSKRFTKINSLLFSAWDQNARYKPCGHFSNKDVGILINLLSGEDGLLTWIDQN